MQEIYHTPGFCKKWKSLLIEEFKFKEYENFIVIRTIKGEKKLVYLPALDYTDLTIDNIEKIKEKAGNKSYQIRILNFDDKQFIKNEPVTMRLSLENMDTEYIKMKMFTHSLKKDLKKAERSSINLKVFENKIERNYYDLYYSTMHYHGSPALPYKFIKNVAKTFPSCNINAYYNKVIVGGIILIYDENLAWAVFGAVDRNFRQYCPNQLILWKAIQLCKLSDKIIFDFGRSPYGGNTYNFKKHWGAKPIKINIIRDIDYNIYNKYDKVSKIWQKIPNHIAKILGPKLIKYTEDF